MNPPLLFPHSPTSLCLKSATTIRLQSLSSSSLSTNLIFNGNGRRRRRRRRGPPLNITAATSSLKQAVSFAISLRDLLSRTAAAADPFSLFLLHHGGGGGGGGWIGLPPAGGSDGNWFRNGRRGNIMGFVWLLSFAISIAPLIFGVGNKAGGWGLGVRVLVPAVLGLKFTFWRNWTGILMISGSAFYVLLRRSQSRRRR